MTAGRYSGAEPQRSSTTGEVLEATRRSVVGVVGEHSGTGWVALANGLVVTSLEVVGYAETATLVLEDGARVPARVVGCDVGYDTAFLLPERILGLGPIRRALQPAKLGDPAIALRRAPGLAVLETSLCCVDRAAAARSWLEVFPALPLSAAGAPLLEPSGRVIGLVARRAPEAGLAVPVAAIERELLALDRPAAQLGDRAPVYRCPSCNDAFTPEGDRCLSCGSLLPFVAAGRASAASDRVVRDALAVLGIVANGASSGAGAWRILRRVEGGPELPTEVRLALDERGAELMLRAPVVRLPSADHEALYRLLLTLNDLTAGALRLCVAGRFVELCANEPVAIGREREIAAGIDELVLHADHYRKALAAAYGAEPALTTS